MTQKPIALYSFLEKVNSSHPITLSPKKRVLYHLVKDNMLRFLRPNYYYFLFKKLRNPDAFSKPFVNHVLAYLGYSRASIRFINDRAYDTYMLNHNLDENSVVFDVGGYKGDWSSPLIKKYNPKIFIFEPVPEFYEALVKKFKDNPKVSVFNFGLSNKEETVKMTLDGMGSSIYLKGNQMLDVTMKGISAFLEEKKIFHIDLIKINIEGGEYRLLKRMIDDAVITICDKILIQFHECYPSRKQAHVLRQEITQALQKTHIKEFDYPFVWEGWKKKDL